MLLTLQILSGWNRSKKGGMRGVAANLDVSLDKAFPVLNYDGAF